MDTLKCMEECLDDALMERINETLTKYNFNPSKLLEILLEVQRNVEGQYISKKVAYYIAEELDIKPSRIYDVITFFSAIHQEPRAKYPIEVCESIVCKANGRDGLFDHLKEILEIDLGQVTYDGRFTIEEVPCFGACDKAPAVRINGTVYGHLDTYEKVLDLIRSLV